MEREEKLAQLFINYLEEFAKNSKVLTHWEGYNKKEVERLFACFVKWSDRGIAFDLPDEDNEKIMDEADFDRQYDDSYWSCRSKAMEGLKEDRLINGEIE